MTANRNPISSNHRRAGRLRIIAVLVLLVGVTGAAAAYWVGTRATDWGNDPSMIGYDKSAARQIGTLYGNQGLVVAQLTNKLKEPGTQAFLIVVVAIVIAGGCFYFARLLDYDD
jgi:hypothetical protein